MAGTVPTNDQIINDFPNLVLPKINGEPTLDTIIQNHYQQCENAAKQLFTII